ncbi:hypothetical protein [Parablautia muri]|uniref:hypothetical protein n=1 Tax=Parablautia muri TaxID=2320879 RepID=UPI001371D98C|nr:hypothetical protein [Parablautia muri]
MIGKEISLMVCQFAAGERRWPLRKYEKNTYVTALSTRCAALICAMQLVRMGA